MKRTALAEYAPNAPPPPKAPKVQEVQEVRPGVLPGVQRPDTPRPPPQGTSWRAAGANPVALLQIAGEDAQVMGLESHQGLAPKLHFFAPASCEQRQRGSPGSPAGAGAPVQLRQGQPMNPPSSKALVREFYGNPQSVPAYARWWPLPQQLAAWQRQNAAVIADLRQQSFPLVAFDPAAQGAAANAAAVAAGASAAAYAAASAAAAAAAAARCLPVVSAAAGSGAGGGGDETEVDDDETDIDDECLGLPLARSNSRLAGSIILPLRQGGSRCSERCLAVEAAQPSLAHSPTTTTQRTAASALRYRALQGLSW